ncbi:MAG: roadblock/LC7 domain-containing protein [candidate division KSB1 bacterium]|nr:roadblock/LC7 domain-containing protein [candidate division KSB1 bacterium]
MLIGKRETVTKLVGNFPFQDQSKVSSLAEGIEEQDDGHRRPMGKGEMLTRILIDLKARERDIEGAALVSTEGFVIAAALPAHLEEDHVAAISAVVLSLGERITTELAKGTLEQIFVRGSTGYVFLTQVGSDSLLTIITNLDVKLGMVFLDAKRTVAELQKIL